MEELSLRSSFSPKKSSFLPKTSIIDKLTPRCSEAHGTGTQAGDTVEIESITNVFAPLTNPRRRPDNPLFMGAVKANVGHGESAAGVMALIKVLLMYQKEIIVSLLLQRQKRC